jgi:hypothetical protein
MKDVLIAFDDRELRDWLLNLIEERPCEFLGALAEAVVAATVEDYRLIRPALLNLKHKYCCADENLECAPSSITRDEESPETLARRTQIQ